MEKLLFTPLSGIQLTQAVPNSKIIDYNELHKSNSIIDLFTNNGNYIPCIFLLYIRKQEDKGGGLKQVIGHWVALFKSDLDDKIHFFDPYGLPPDDKIYFRQSEEDIKPVLKDMLKDYGNWTWNKQQFQYFEPPYETCGRWCAVRMYFRNKTHEEFEDLIKTMMKEYKEEPDPVIVRLFKEI